MRARATAAGRARWACPGTRPDPHPARPALPAPGGPWEPAARRDHASETHDRSLRL